MTDKLNLEDIPLGGIREDDHLFKQTNDGTCSRCREELAEAEVPLMLWPSGADGDDLYQFCQRCAWDPDSDRCKNCGCTTNHSCEMPCGWAEPGLCTNCKEARPNEPS
jgi:hypothetical protein